MCLPLKRRVVIVHDPTSMKANNIKKITKAYLLILVIAVLILLGKEAIEITQSSSFSFNALINTLVQTSLIAFFSTLLFLAVTFKWNRKSYVLWLILLFNLPVAIIYSPIIYQNIRLSIIDTTTQPEFRYSNTVGKLKYNRDIENIEVKIDSLIRLGVVTQPTDYGERFFEGTTYKDSLERRRGFPATPYKLPLKLSVDTLFYSPDSSNFIAGTLIRKYPVDYPEYSNGDTVQFLGDAFIFNPNNYGFQFLTLRTSISRYSSEQDCSSALLDVYLKERGLRDGYYNINDIRFWTNTDWERKFKPYTFD